MKIGLGRALDFRCALIVLTALWFCLPTAAAAQGTTGGGQAPVSPVLAVAPSLVDVGQAVSFTVSATRWPAPAYVSLSFSSPHHGFRGAMRWYASCSCFRAAILLSKVVHPLELGRVTAVITSGMRSMRLAASFEIRGLAPDRHSYAPGGNSILAAWVADPEPNLQEQEDICAWVHTVDGVGVVGYPVHIVVHFVAQQHTYNAGNTASSGMACAHLTMKNQPPGMEIPVDIYAGPLHARTTITPRG